MVIKILGPGCANCHRLEKVARKAAENVGIAAEFAKVDDYRAIASYGVMSTPALVIDEEVKLSGRVPDVDEVERILSDAAK